MNSFLAGLLVILAVAGAFLLLALVVWWLVPLAFPALSFSYTNAMALSLLMILFGGLASAG